MNELQRNKRRIGLGKNENLKFEIGDRELKDYLERFPIDESVYIETDFDLLENHEKEIMFHEFTIDLKPRSVDCCYFYLQPDYSAEVRFETVMTNHHRTPVNGNTAVCTRLY